MDSKIRRIYVPMTESGFYILFCLRHPQHGYGISRQVKEMTGGDLVISAGTMYGTLSKMENDFEIFSDNNSRIAMVDYIIKTRMLPLLIIFFCCVIPNFFKSIAGVLVFNDVFTALFAILFIMYLYLFIHCGLKLNRLKKKYGVRR